MNSRKKVLITLGVGTYLFGVGMLAGVAIDRMRYDQHRSEVLDRYEQTLREWQTQRMALEKSAADQR